MKKKMNITKATSLRYQLLSRFLIILLLLLVILELFQYSNMKKYLYSSKEQLLQSRLGNLDIVEFLKVQTTEEVSKNANYFISKVIDENMSVSIIDNQGNIISSANKSDKVLGPSTDNKIDTINKSEYLSVDDKHAHTEKNFTPVPKLSNNEYKKIMQLNGKLEGTYRIIKDENKNWQIIVWSKIGSLDDPSGLIQVSTTIIDINEMLYRQLSMYMGVSILILLMGGALGILTVNRTLRPLYNMTSTLEQINVDGLDIRLPVNNKQIEVDKLSYAFNNMLERIEISFQKEHYIREKMRQFVSDASHELRTPLTSIHGFVEVLLRGAARDEKKLNLGLNTILSESERLTKLVNDLLFLTKADQQIPIEMITSDLNQIIKEIYPQLQILGGNRRIELTLNDSDRIYVNRNQIKQVIFNLVQNAVQHTEEKDGIINITIDSVEKSSNNYVTLKIEDNGTGIKREHLNGIFDRFFRSESHRSRMHGGYGLGLSIVKSIVDAHSGIIEVESSLGQGTMFLIYLKKSDEL